jgi:hypothetical protein
MLSVGSGARVTVDTVLEREILLERCSDGVIEHDSDKLRIANDLLMLPELAAVKLYWLRDAEIVEEADRDSSFDRVDVRVGTPGGGGGGGFADAIHKISAQHKAAANALWSGTVLHAQHRWKYGISKKKNFSLLKFVEIG